MRQNVSRERKRRGCASSKTSQRLKWWSSQGFWNRRVFDEAEVFNGSFLPSGTLDLGKWCPLDDFLPFEFREGR